MTRSFIVTYPAPRTELHAVKIENDDGRVVVPWQYRVDVDAPDGCAPDKVRALALRTSDPLHNAALGAWFAGGQQAVAAVPVPVRSQQQAAVPAQEAGPVFDPEEIMPFVLAARAGAVAIAQAPIRLELTGEVETAGTDCRANIMLNPEPYLRGQVQAGDGHVYHEASHIRFDRDGGRLLALAWEEGGSLLRDILNLVMDRRSDDLNCREHRGFARPVRRRLGSLMPGVTDRHGVCTQAHSEVFVDFAYACKKRTRPCHDVVRKCVNLAKCAIRSVNSRQRPYHELLEVSKRIRVLLLTAMPPDERRREAQLMRFDEFMRRLMRLVRGKPAGKGMRQTFRGAMAARLAAQRRNAIQGLAKLVEQMGSNAGGYVGVDDPDGVGAKIVDIGPAPAAYAASLARVRHLVPGMRQALEELAQPIKVEYRGLDSGDLDEDEIALLAAGGRAVFMHTDERPELDAAVALLLDVSSSMSGRTDTLDMGTLMNETMLGNRSVDMSLWGFNNVVFRCGAPSRSNGIAGLKWAGGTDETAGLRVAGGSLLSSMRAHRLVVTVCDGGPANPADVKRTCEELLARGVVPVRLLVGVDAAPRTYPVELFFDSFEEVFRELSGFFRSLMLATRS